MKKHSPELFKALLFTLASLSLILGNTTVAAAPQPASPPWWGEYYNNTSLSGAPVLTRYDDAINFGWGSRSPASGLPKDNFSVRWTREAWFDGGTYRFKILADDGVRLWVGDQLVVDEWRDRLAVPFYMDRYIPAGTYRVMIEYYEHWGDATCAIGWTRVVGGETWIGEYFDNRKLEDSPALTRNDNAIDFDWDSGSPDPAIPADNFSVRWTRVVEFDAGTYRFLTSTDDGVRVWVDGGLVVDAWYDQKLPNTRTGEVYLAAGRHTITVEYYEHKDKAHAHVWWQLREPSLPQPGYWHGQYFDNPDFVGGPALERDDADINFDWGVEPPVSWMPDDNFTIRWTRTVDFAPGYYRFAVLADDGVRVWLDYGVIIDKWQDMDYELHYVDGTYLQGQHTIKVEYYEHTGHAHVRFWWESSAAGNAPPTYVPAQPAAAPAAETAPAGADPWQAAYFANTTLSGEPVLTRIETALDHNWGFSSPGPTVPVDDFSARWTQSVYLTAGTYRFTTYTDDGVRLWVDGRLLINSWYPMRGYRSATVWLGEGPHEVRMEYYERGGVALARLTWQRLY